jgi:hypothetical protein
MRAVQEAQIRAQVTLLALDGMQTIATTKFIESAKRGQTAGAFMT